MSAAIGSSNSSSDTNGLFVDVRDFGAKAVPDFDNTAAFQAAVDYVVSKGGGTVYIPGCGSFPNYYYLKKPVYVNGDKVAIVGDGKRATTLWTWGPAFFFGPHPSKWKTLNTTSYVDTDTGATVPVRDAQGNFIFDQRYRTDLYRFTANGDLKAGSSGQAPLDINIQPNNWYGVRGRGVVKGYFMGNPLATGDLEGWESKKQATFDFIYYAHDKVVEGGIAGMGERNNPDPWLLDVFNGSFEFWMSLTDDSLVNRGVIRLSFPHPVTKGLHRVSVQVDWTNQNITVFVDRVQVNYTIDYVSNIQPSELFTKYNSFARWEYSDFNILSRNRNTSLNDDTGMVNSDYTVIAVKAFPFAKYIRKMTGQSMTRIDGNPIYDADNFPWTNDGAIGGLNIYENSGVDLLVLNSNSDRSYGMMAPIGEGPTAIAFCRLADLSIVGYGSAHYSDGITLSNYLHLDIENVSIREGFFNSIGGTNMIVSYPLHMRNCELGSYGNGFFGLNSSFVHAIDTTFGYVGRSAIRTAGCGTIWDGAITNDFTPTAEGFFIGYAGYGIGAGHRFENIMIDTEGARVSPKVAMFLLQKSWYHYGNKLVIKNVCYGSNTNTPAVYLDDPVIHDWTNFPCQFQLEVCDFNSDGPLVRVKGKDWRGTLMARRIECGDNVLEIMPSTYSYSNIKTTHDDFYAPPNLGGWQQNSHVINIGNPNKGSVAVWGCGSSGAEGSSSPPVWIPLEFVPTRNRNTLCGNIFATFTMNMKAFHPSFPSSPADLRFALFTDAGASKALAYLLNNSGAIYRDKIMFGLHPLLPSRWQQMTDSLKKSSRLSNDNTLWNTASNGQKTNKSAIVISGSSWDQDYLVRQRPQGFIFVLGDTSWSGDKITNVISGRSTPQKAGFFDSQSVTIPVGGLTLGNSTRDGSWSNFASNKIFDWLFGYPTTTFPTTFYIGLSSTPITATGTGATEPAGGSYSRVAVPLSSGNFKAHDEYGSTWSNANSINFNTPTSYWGNCDWFFLSDSATGGNIWASGPLHRPLTLTADSTAPAFLPGCLQIQL